RACVRVCVSCIFVFFTSFLSSLHASIPPLLPSFHASIPSLLPPCFPKALSLSSVLSLNAQLVPMLTLPLSFPLFLSHDLIPSLFRSRAHSHTHTHTHTHGLMYPHICIYKHT